MATVACFEINYTQILDDKGELCAPLPAFAEDQNILCDLYKKMVLSHLFDKKAIALQRTGKMGTYAPINGQEAIATAIGHVMQPHDVFIPYYRDYAAQFQRGVTMMDIFAYWGGDERGSDFKNKEDLPICVPIASQCLHAAGVAFAFKHRQQPRVAVTCIGDGGTSEGDFYEALNVAGLWKLPVVFVINNNQWAISVPLSEQTASQTLAQKAIAAGVEGLQVDGNDIIACCTVLENALEKARNGGGPTLIEAITYRLCDHTTADDATRYQPPEDVQSALHKEPIARLKHYLETKGFWNKDKEVQLIEQCQEKIAKSVDSYENRPMQPVQSMFDYHFETLPEYLIEQRAIAMEEASNV